MRPCVAEAAPLTLSNGELLAERSGARARAAYGRPRASASGNQGANLKGFVAPSIP